MIQFLPSRQTEGWRPIIRRMKTNYNYHFAPIILCPWQLVSELRIKTNSCVPCTKPLLAGHHHSNWEILSFIFAQEVPSTRVSPAVRQSETMIQITNPPTSSYFLVFKRKCWAIIWSCQNSSQKIQHPIVITQKSISSKHIIPKIYHSVCFNIFQGLNHLNHYLFSKLHGIHKIIPALLIILDVMM